MLQVQQGQPRTALAQQPVNPVAVEAAGEQLELAELVQARQRRQEVAVLVHVEIHVDGTRTESRFN